MATYKFTRHAPPISIYTRFRVKNSMRSARTPRVAKAWRTRKLMSLTAFFRNRFYEIDRWYKARIEKPVVYPTCYFIDPDDHILSLEERLNALHLEQNADRQLVDIGQPFDTSDQIVKSKEISLLDKTLETQHRTELERLSRLRQLRLEPAEVDGDQKNERIRVRLAKQLADHFGIFKDLFHPDAYFYPTTNLHIGYTDSERADILNPVFYGNSLTPSQTLTRPNVVDFTPEHPDALYTLMMVNPDGCLYENDREVLHWMVCNIPNGKVDQGAETCPYLQPLPLKGTGWHRTVFVLFKQERAWNEEEIKNLKLSNPSNFEQRTFNAPEFYLKHENQITPVGLSFFQTIWDKSCTICFHEVLKMEQPLYDFEWPAPHFEPQEEFPSDYKPFNEYLDQYRDYKDIDKEILTKRLKRTSPFQKDEPKSKFPNLFVYDRERDSRATWQYLEQIKQNEGYGKYKGLYENRID